ncbi:hypothetical protein [Brevibacillus brevis]|nr:hypothetical protein [Brevibacillus brevis]
MLVWAILHGMGSLMMNGRIAGGQERVKMLVVQHARQTLATLRHTAKLE